MTIYDYYPGIFEKQVPLSLYDIPSRNYLHWKKENLLNSGKKAKIKGAGKREKVFLNVFDALWLLIIKELREFNVDFPTIRAIKDIMYSPIIIDTDKVNTSSPQEFAGRVLKHFPEELKEAITPFLKDGSFFSLLHEVIDEKNYILFQNIGGIFTDILLREVAVSLIVKKNRGDVEVNFLKNENSSKDWNAEVAGMASDFFSNDTFLHIPMAPLVGKMFENSALDKYNFQFYIYNESERKIIDALNDDLCKEIRVSKHQSGDISLNLTFEEDLKNENAKEIRKILGLKQYEKIELVYRNDKHIVVHNTRREILKKQQ